MSDLFENAVLSIKLGVDDYQANESGRALSAIRNLHAGLLLLAKEVLVRAVPNADENDIIADQYKPVPDGSGGVKYIPESKRTIDLAKIGSRFKDFGLRIDRTMLKALNDIRNDIEHCYPKVPNHAMQQAIARAFPTVAELFRLAGEEPHKSLGETWETMLKTHTFYEREFQDCHGTFGNIQWRSDILQELTFNCLKCQSTLVAQDNPENSQLEHAEAHCRACGTKVAVETQVVCGLAARFEWDNYSAKKDGGGAPLQDCPDCGLCTYILNEEHIGCVWCGCTLGTCARCAIHLIPDDIFVDDHNFCSYCSHVLAKDD